MLTALIEGKLEDCKTLPYLEENMTGKNKSLIERLSFLDVLN
jgi:hypothetical protein